MSLNKGKQFESKFKEDWLKTVPNSSIDRLYDQVSGYKFLSNISDFIGYSYPNIFYLECKTIKGKSFPFANLSQYEKLTAKVGIKGVRAGVVIWFYEYDKVLYIPISTITQMKKENKKSLNIDLINKEKYRILDIPSTKKRVFMDSDYSVLLTLKDSE